MIELTFAQMHPYAVLNSDGMVTKRFTNGQLALQSLEASNPDDGHFLDCPEGTFSRTEALWNLKKIPNWGTPRKAAVLVG